MYGQIFTLLSYMGGDAEIDVAVVRGRRGRRSGGDVVEQVREPEEIVAVADHPVEVDAFVGAEIVVREIC